MELFQNKQVSIMLRKTVFYFTCSWFCPSIPKLPYKELWDLKGHLTRDEKENRNPKICFVASVALRNQRKSHIKWHKYISLLPWRNGYIKLCRQSLCRSGRL